MPSQDFKSALQDPIPEVTLTQKCLTEICTIYKCYPAMGSLSAGVVCRSGHVHVNMTVQSVHAVKTCSKSNSIHTVFLSYMGIHTVYRLCYSNATAAVEEYQLQHP